MKLITIAVIERMSASMQLPPAGVLAATDIDDGFLAERCHRVDVVVVVVEHATQLRIRRVLDHFEALAFSVVQVELLVLAEVDLAVPAGGLAELAPVQASGIGAA